jgi:hypothetical protein
VTELLTSNENLKKFWELERDDWTILVVEVDYRRDGIFNVDIKDVADTGIGRWLGDPDMSGWYRLDGHFTCGWVLEGEEVGMDSSKGEMVLYLICMIW